MSTSAANLRVKLETVTPLFLGGADPRDKPELRAPSFRGALRYWLRAALGGVQGDADLGPLREAEAKVFGAAGSDSACASAIGVRLQAAQQLATVSYSQLVRGRAGLAYLWFAARGTQREQERSGLTGGFYLQLALRQGQSADLLEKAYLALWLLTRFGGVGTRTRRGAGAVQVVQQDRVLIDDLPLVIRARTPKELADELASGLRKVRTVLGEGYSTVVRKPSEFDLIHPETCRIWVLEKPYGRWEEALDEFGRCFSGFRRRRNPDYRELRAAVHENRDGMRPIERAAFGLPMPLYFQSTKQQATLRPTNRDRRMSPLIVRPVKLASGQYAIVLVWFRSRFLPEGEALLLHAGARSVRGPLPDDGLISTFIEGSDPINGSSLRDCSLQAREVRYG